MKIKEETSKSRYFYNVKMYLDDVEYILSLLENENLSITLENDTHQYDSLEEVCENMGEKVNSLEVKGEQKKDFHYGFVSFEIDKDSRRIYCSNKELFGVFYAIEEFLSKKTKPILIVFSVFAWGLLLYLSLITRLIIGFKDQSFFGYPLFTSIIFTFTLLLLLSIYIKITHRGVYLVRRHVSKNFFSRNKDKFILLIIGGIFTLFVNYILSLINN